VHRWRPRRRRSHRDLLISQGTDHAEHRAERPRPHAGAVGSTVQIATDRAREGDVRAITQGWADSVEWEVIEVSTTADSVNVRVIGSPPIPETASYRDALVVGGIDPDGVVVEFIPRTVVALGDNFVGLVPD